MGKKAPVIIGDNETTPVFVICEGACTEPQYFKLLNREYRDNGKFDIKPVPKIGIDWHNSHRGDLVGYIEGYVNKQINNILTPFYKSTVIIDDCYDQILSTYRPNDKNSEKIKEILFKIRRAINDAGSTIDEKDVEKAVETSINENKDLTRILKELSRNLKEPKDFHYSCEDIDEIRDNYFSKDKSDKGTYDPGNYSVFVVFDRDYNANPDYERTDEDYEKYIGECRERSKNYVVLLTNPAFELWLLMHHEDVDYSELEGFFGELSLRKIQGKLFTLEDPDFTEDLLDDEDYMRKMKSIINRYDNYEGKFNTAYKTSINDYFTNKLSNPNDKTISLINDPGTNVGEILNGLINRKTTS